MAFENILSPVVLKKYVEFWISEDISGFDLSAIALNAKDVCAHILMNEDGVLAGLPFVEAVFKYLDCVVEWLYTEGTFIKGKSVVCVVRGLSSKLMMAERTALNILCRASGVATIARRVHTKIQSTWKGEISGTRKTSPGMKVVEKYAMYVGGISTHRYDLSSMIMLKDNHIAVNGSIENSVKMIKAKVGSLIMVEVECKSASEALESAKSGANAIMLDNFNAEDVKTVSKQVKEAYPSVLIEVSGGINENNIMSYTVANVDIISSSIFCQGYKCIDLSLNVVNETISLTPEIVETDNNEISSLDLEVIEVIDLELVDKSNDFNFPETTTTSTPKAGIKRKIDETPAKTEDNNKVAATGDNSIKETEKKTPAQVSAAVPAKVADVTPNKQVKVGANVVASTPVSTVASVSASVASTAKASVVTTAAMKTSTTTKSGTSISSTASISSIRSSIANKTGANNSGRTSIGGAITKNAPGKANNTTGTNAAKAMGKVNTMGKVTTPNTNTRNQGGYQQGTPRYGMQGNSPGYSQMHQSNGRSMDPMSMMRPMGSYGASSGGGSMGNHGHAMLSSFSDNNHNDSFFHGATPSKIGPSMNRSMNNLVDQRGMPDPSYRSMGPGPNSDLGYGFYCNTCKFQNPINGPPICRMCRKMLS